jgi:uncharacterized protein YgbK (DUF1537 family)
MLLGCIADDYTGASDLANTLTKSGMRTIQLIGLPEEEIAPDNADAVVVALKSRSIPAKEAVSQSVKALAWLQQAGCQQILFKYCSTFDSTDSGNIGPVAEVLLKILNASAAIVCPAFPENKRTIYNGHLFVGSTLLSESGMEKHPLNPMKDANLVRVLQAQTNLKVGLIDYSIVDKGAEAIKSSIELASKAGEQLLVVDAISNEHLLQIGKALADAPLITGGSGIALGLPENFRAKDKLKIAEPYSAKVAGPAVVLSGSCSHATNAQVKHYVTNNPSFKLDVSQLMKGDLSEKLVSEVSNWILDRTQEEAPLVYSSATSDSVTNLQNEYGQEELSSAIENFFGKLALRLHQQGIRRFIIAGGETSGAVVNSLGVRAFRIGKEIDPGVPALFGVQEPKTAFVLKSGNFGSVDFFTKAQSFI